jgi:hypothetical protein
MIIWCGTPGCTTFEKRSVNRRIDGTNLYKTHYKTHHLGVPTSVEEENVFDSLYLASDSYES